MAPEWSPTRLQMKFFQDYTRVVRHARAITFQPAEAAVSGLMVCAVIAAIQRLRACGSLGLALAAGSPPLRRLSPGCCRVHGGPCGLGLGTVMSGVVEYIPARTVRPPRLKLEETAQIPFTYVAIFPELLSEFTGD